MPRTKKNVFFVITCTISYASFMLLRIKMGLDMGLWIPASAGYDDALMVNYATLPENSANIPNNHLMLKEMGMPWFYKFVRFTNLPESFYISCLWCIAAVLISLVCYELTRKQIIAFFFFAFTLFSPSAFDASCGTRLYRTQLLNPMYIIVLSMAVLLAIRLSVTNKCQIMLNIILSILLGLVFSYTYCIKEDGIWLLVTVILILIVGIIGSIPKWKKLIEGKLLVKSFFSLVIPLFIFSIFLSAYKLSNLHYYGVYKTNTRTSGESGQFVEYVYKIESDERTNSVWAPYEAIERAFQASETLQNHPELMEAIWTSNWLGGDIKSNPIQGDFFGWVLADAVYDCGIATNQAEKEVFFSKVNDELQDAFEDGTLQEDESRIQIISSVGGKTIDELKGIAGNCKYIYAHHVLLDNYKPGARHFEDCEDKEMFLLASEYVNADVTRPLGKDSANDIARTIFKLYKILFPVVIILSAIGVLFGMIEFVNILKRRRKGNVSHGQEVTPLIIRIVLCIGAYAMSYVYSFAIMLFCTQFVERRTNAEKMYGIGVVSLLLMGAVIGVSLLIQCGGDMFVRRSYK